MDLLKHAIEHLEMGKSRDLRFAILHADNAIELLLKELARYNGIRLMDRAGRSLGYYECVDKLEAKGIKIPNLPDIDILHTERNSIYHLGSQPDKEKTEWLVYNVALNLAMNICKEKFDYDLRTYSREFSMPSNILDDVVTNTNDQMTRRYLKEALYALDNGLYNSSIVASYTAIEVFLRKGIPIDLRKGINELKTLIDDELIDENDLKEITFLRNLRNKVLHEGYPATKEEATFAIEVSRKIIGEIDSVLM